MSETKFEVKMEELETMDKHHVVHMVQRTMNSDTTLSDIFNNLSLDKEQKVFLFKIIKEFFKRMNEYSKKIIDETVGRDSDIDLGDL